MRRQIVLLAVLTAILVAIALLRPRTSVQKRPVPSSPVPMAPVEAPEEIEDREPSPPPPLPAARSEAPLPPTAKTRVPDRECLLIIVNTAGDAVPGAIVLILKHDHSRPSAQTKVEEKRANESGHVTLTMGPYDSADALAYKVGVGTGASGLITNQVDRSIKLMAGLNLKVRTFGVSDVPLEGAEVVLTTEVLFADARDAYGSRSLIVVSLPARKVSTALDGSCLIDAVFPPAHYKGGWKATPGIRHRLTAEWNRMTAKQNIDKAPEGPVVLYLQ